MSAAKPESYFVGINYKDGTVIGHTCTLKPPTGSVDAEQPPRQESVEKEPSAVSNFESVITNFASSMHSYLGFIHLTLQLAPFLSSTIAGRRIVSFTESKGTLRADLSSDTKNIYELDINTYGEFSRHNDEIGSALEGARRLPKVMLIGLVSVFDAYLAQLLKLVFSKHEQIVLVADKSIKFSDLSKYASIENAKATLIDNEIEDLMRGSHQKQMKYLEGTLKLSLKDDLKVWPAFIEICERRNLLTHTAGVVSSQYLSVCEENKCDIQGVKLGDTLKVDPAFFTNSVKTVYEVGVRIGYGMWRKFAPKEQHEADIAFNELCYNLIYARHYKLAESLLGFSSNLIKKHGEDRTRRTMVINYANAVRLQGRKEDAIKIIDAEDWSSSNDRFLICANAVKGNVEKVADLMTSASGKEVITAEEFRTWPIFRSIKADAKFLETFEGVFNEPFIIVKANEADGFGGLGIAVSPKQIEEEKQN